MERLISRLSPVLHLTRITNAVAAVANVWFLILWTRAAPIEQDTAPLPILTQPLWLLLGAGLILAIALFAYAMALNDTLDIRRDRALYPERPIPSGRISLDTAVTLIAASIIISTLAALILGTAATAMCLLVAASILVYNTSLKYFPSIGLVLLGLIYAAHMLIPNIRLQFVWPVWLAMTHALLIGALTHHLLTKRPALTPPILALAGAGWLFWSAVLLAVGWRRTGHLWPEAIAPTTAIAPTLLFIAFILLAWRKAHKATSRARAAEKIQRYGSLWLTLYAVAWMAAEQHLAESIILASLAALGFLGMTTLREVYSLLEFPVGYRR